MTPQTGDVVYVAKLTVTGLLADEVTCVPVKKVVWSIGPQTLHFTDGTEQYRDKCFPSSEAGFIACQTWCQEIITHQLGFRWPVRVPV
jgi:hypothetical protein